MKNHIFIAIISLILLSSIVSCSFFDASFEDEETKLIFSLPSSVARSTKQDVESLTINLKGITNQSKTIKLSETTSVTFNNLLVGKTVYAEAFAFDNANNCIFSGKSKEIMIYEGENTAELLLKDPASYTITLDANGGTFSDGKNRREIHITSALTKASEMGLTFGTNIFKGWAISGNTVAYKDGDGFIPVEDITLYAVWKETGGPQMGTSIALLFTEMYDGEAFFVIEFKDTAGNTLFENESTAHHCDRMDFSPSILTAEEGDTIYVSVNIYTDNTRTTFLYGTTTPPPQFNYSATESRVVTIELQGA